MCATRFMFKVEIQKFVDLQGTEFMHSILLSLKLGTIPCDDCVTPVRLID